MYLKIRLVVLYFSIVCNGIYAQGGYMPILIGDKYGLTNEKMEIVLPGTYDEMVTAKDAKLALGKTSTGWDIIGKDGKVLLKNALQGSFKQNYSGPTGISIQPAFANTSTGESGKFSSSELYKISDPEYKRTYYINPNVPLTSYASYQLPEKKSYWSFADPAPDQVMTGLIKVVMEDGKTNFIDTSGHLVLKENVTEAAAYGSNVIVVMDENNLFRVYDRQQRLLSENVYEHVYYKKKSGHIQLRKPIPGTDSQYDLFDSQGAMLLSDRKLIASGTEEFIIEYDLEGAYLYNGQGVLRKSFPAAKLFFNDVNYNLPLLIINNKIGLIDSEGKIVLEPVYDNLLPMRDSTMAFKRGTRGGILDKTLKEKWSMDSIEIKEFIRESPEHYEIHHIRDYYTGYGVANSNGKIIVPPVYKSVSHTKEFDFFIAKGDPISAIYDVNGNMLTRINADKYVFNFPEIKVTTADSVKVYDSSFRMIHAWDKAKEELDSFKKADAYGMKNAMGQVVTEPKYSFIRRLQETITGKWGYLANHVEEEEDVETADEHCSAPYIHYSQYR